MPIFGGHDHVEPQADSASREQEQQEANQAAERRLAEYQCEHAGKDAAEAEAVDRSAEVMERWEQANPTERPYILERVGREMMKVHEAPNPPASPKEFEDPRTLGQYLDEDWRIEIKGRDLKEPGPRAALETYLHEYRHAEQYYEVQKSHGSLAHEVDADRAEKFEREKDNYVSEGKEYWEQSIEKDAEKFGVEMADRILKERAELRSTSGAEVTSPADDIARRRLVETEKAG